MVSPALEAPGIRLDARELLALREGAPGNRRTQPASRRPGAAPTRAPGAGMDLREIRAFAEGDDARRLDPSATARTGIPHIRTFHEDRDDTLLLIVDFRPPMLWGTGASLRSVRAARLAARRGWQAVLRGASLAAISVNAEGVAAVPLAGGVPQMVRISHMLASRHDQALGGGGGAPSLEEALVRAARLCPPGGDVLIATGPEGLAPEDEPALARLARRRQVRVLLPLDTIETAPPEGALPIQAGALTCLAQLRPFDRAALAQRLRPLNVSLEVVDHDAG
ncbi:DUF58 domain-containing protein [Ancylobacter sp. VKM B-3255]|uniref:DUF58 domain-containing protein n=2 Tax=Ancylobacter radicis TaxID=2836179 RepID=A0ABS5R5C5_9HYPH|nr:DUF58 domain-containing protein [Ancylobacter radicis]